MGQFEKIVVLIAFFLVTVILVVTFTTPKDEVFSMGEDTLADASRREGVEESRDGGPQDPVVITEPEGLSRELPNPGSNPRRGHRDENEQSSASNAGGPRPTGADKEGEGTLAGHSLQDLSRQDKSRQGDGRRGDLLLDDAFSASKPRGAELPVGAALITLEGLTSTFDTSIMEYTWGRGDTWNAVAQRLYGDKSMAQLLQQFNEGSDYRAPGESILVPVFDGRESSRIAKDEQSSGSKQASKDEELSEERGNLYRVEDGDSLWVISKKVYGKGSQWEKIFEANKDVLDSPDDVKPGMGLRIP